MRTSHKTPVSFSDSLQVSVPTSWDELNEEQLYYVLRLIAHGVPMERTMLYAFLQFSALKVIRRYAPSTLLVRYKNAPYVITREDLLLGATSQDYLETPPKSPVRLNKWRQTVAVNPALHGVRFGVYLQAENYFQGYLTERNNKYLMQLGYLLYPGLETKGRDDWSKEEQDIFCTNVLLWYTGFKQLLVEQFPELFRSTDTTGETLDMREIMFAQIRILTSGDVTKEHRVLNVDTWSALGELNEKIKESKRLDRMLKK